MKDMKPGDVVTLTDTSYAIELYGGHLRDVREFDSKRRHRVVAVHGSYPTTYRPGCCDRPHSNDAMLVDVDNLSVVTFIQHEFCRGPQPTPPPFKCGDVLIHKASRHQAVFVGWQHDKIVVEFGPHDGDIAIPEAYELAE